MNKSCFHPKRAIVKIEGPQLDKTELYCDPAFEIIYHKWCDKCGSFYDGLKGIWYNIKS